MNIDDKIDLTLKQELEQLHATSTHYLAELTFFDDECRFLKILLNRYFTLQLNSGYLNRVQLIEKQLAQLSMLKGNITEDALKHQGHIIAKIKKLLFHDLQFLGLESKRIHNEIDDLNKSFKHLKKEIFAIFKSADGNTVKP